MGGSVSTAPPMDTGSRWAAANAATPPRSTGVGVVPLAGVTAQSSRARPTTSRSPLTAVTAALTPAAAATASGDGARCGSDAARTGRSRVRTALIGPLSHEPAPVRSEARRR